MFRSVNEEDVWWAQNWDLWRQIWKSQERVWWTSDQQHWSCTVSPALNEEAPSLGKNKNIMTRPWCVVVVDMVVVVVGRPTEYKTCFVFALRIKAVAAAAAILLPLGLNRIFKRRIEYIYEEWWKKTMEEEWKMKKKSGEKSWFADKIFSTTLHAIWVTIVYSRDWIGKKDLGAVKNL